MSREGTEATLPRRAGITGVFSGGVGRPRLRTLAFAVAVLVALTAGWLWLRDSSLVKVQRVSISGLPGGSAPIRATLRDAAMDMTTLHVRVDQLRTAAAPFPIVKDVRVHADFPHGLRIEVIPYVPVAVVESGGARVPIAGDGTILRGAVAAKGLPSIPVSLPPGGRRLTDPAARRAVALLAAAPAALLGRITKVTTDPGRLAVTLRDGPELRFGGPDRLAAKWAAAARVLADPGSKGATYLDLRVPERPAAGGLGPDRSSTPAPPPGAVSETPAATQGGATGQTPTATAPAATAPATTTPAQTPQSTPTTATPTP